MSKLGFKSPTSGLGLRKTAVQQVSVPAHVRSLPQKRSEPSTHSGNVAKISMNTKGSGTCATCGASLPSAHTDYAHSCGNANAQDMGGSNQTY